MGSNIEDYKNEDCNCPHTNTILKKGEKLNSKMQFTNH